MWGDSFERMEMQDEMRQAREQDEANAERYEREQLELKRVAFNKARNDRDLAACRITGVITALIKMGRLDDLQEALPHTYNDLCGYVADYDVATDFIMEDIKRGLT